MNVSYSEASPIQLKPMTKQKMKLTTLADSARYFSNSVLTPKYTLLINYTDLKRQGTPHSANSRPISVQ